jgi:hypothetical protein
VAGPSCGRITCVQLVAVDELAFLTAHQPQRGQENYGKVNRTFLSDKLDKVYALPCTQNHMLRVSRLYMFLY